MLIVKPLKMEDRWIPEQIWKGRPAYLIGGGHSLRAFPMQLLTGKNTIGSNFAFRLGPEIIKWVCFSDSAWFLSAIQGLKRYAEEGGKVVSGSTSLHEYNLPWLFKMQREREGLYNEEGVIGWNYSTGAMAINLACYFGANPIYLLGYDMGLDKGKSHWHNHYRLTTTEDSFKRHLGGFGIVQKELGKVFPRTKVLNVTNGDSRLTGFDKINFEDFQKTLVKDKGER